MGSQHSVYSMEGHQGDMSAGPTMMFGQNCLKVMQNHFCWMSYSYCFQLDTIMNSFLWLFARGALNRAAQMNAPNSPFYGAHGATFTIGDVEIDWPLVSTDSGYIRPTVVVRCTPQPSDDMVNHHLIPHDLNKAIVQPGDFSPGDTFVDHANRLTPR